MRRVGHLFNQITSYSNLLLASQKAMRSKRYRLDVLQFNHRLETHLLTIQEMLQKQTYRPGPYKTFEIFEPKRRLISAAPYRDRVVQHALCNLIEPVFDRSFSECSYANRKGRGSSLALKDFITLARRHRYCLRLDIRKYFPSQDHAILKEQYRRKIKCPETLWLMDLILDASNPQEEVVHYFDGDDLLTPHERRHGLPIGNLTSQLWANVYLSGLDHKICERFGGKKYLRYVDDFALFSDDREELEKMLEFIRAELSLLRLKLHPGKTDLVDVKNGVNFLGFRIFPTRIRIRQENLKRARRRLKIMQRDYAALKIGPEDVGQSVQSWTAHLKTGNTFRLREKIFGSLVFQRAGKGEDPSGVAGWFLAQRSGELPLLPPRPQQSRRSVRQLRVPLAEGSLLIFALYPFFLLSSTFFDRL